MQFGVSKAEMIWQQNYEELKRFYDENGHINVPKNYLSSDGKKLNVWVLRQRKAKQEGLLSDEQISLLDELGMEWRNIADASYETGFEHLKEYILEHGSENVPINAECKDGYKLGRWIANCKSKFKTGKLKQEYYDRFAELGILLDSEKADTWAQYADEVEVYFEENNVKHLPKNMLGKSGNNLWMWLEDQKKYYRNGTLSAERKARLDKMGYPFSKAKPANTKVRKPAGVQKQNWFANAEKVLKFAENHAPDELHMNTVYDGLNIYNWIRYQRKRYKAGKITDEQQIAVMQKILQIFPVKEHKERDNNAANNNIPHWDMMYEAAVQFFDEHGLDAEIPADYQADNVSLYSWYKRELKIVRHDNGAGRTPIRTNVI